MREPPVQTSQHTDNTTEYTSAEKSRLCAKNGCNNVVTNLLIIIYIGNFACSGTHADKTGLSCRSRKIEVERPGLVSDCFCNGGSDY